MTKHIAINRGMFQGERILNKIKDETGTKQIDVIFGVYSVLEYRKNHIGIAGTTLRDIESFLYNSTESRNVKKVRNALEILKQYNVIAYDYDVNKVKATDMIEVEIVEYKQYMAVSKEDFMLLDKMDSNFFLLYCTINNYHSVKEGYSFVTYDILDSLLSRATISKHLDIAQALGIYDIDSNGWAYDKQRGKALRSNNTYTKNETVVANVVAMSDDEIAKAISDIDKDDNRYKADLGKVIVDKPAFVRHDKGLGKPVAPKVEVEEVEEIKPIAKNRTKGFGKVIDEIAERKASTDKPSTVDISEIGIAKFYESDNTYTIEELREIVKTEISKITMSEIKDGTRDMAETLTIIVNDRKKETVVDKVKDFGNELIQSEDELRKTRAKKDEVESADSVYESENGFTGDWEALIG